MRQVRLTAAAALIATAMLGTSTDCFAADQLKLAVGGRGVGETFVTEIGYKAGLFKKHNLELDLFYTDGGAGRPMVFVASAWLDSRMWEFQIPYLVDHGFRCIAYDRRGHGRSDSSWDGYDYDTLADDLGTLLDHLDLRDLTLVSHSAGSGEIVQYLTGYGGARVAQIAIVSGTTPCLMKRPDNPDGIELELVGADLATRTADRPKWFADNAAGFFGVGLPGIRVSPEIHRVRDSPVPRLLSACDRPVLPDRLHQRSP